VKRVLLVLAVCAVVATVASSSAFAGVEWPLPAWDAQSGAFTVRSWAYRDPVQAYGHAWYYYYWDVTLNDTNTNPGDGSGYFAGTDGVAGGEILKWDAFSFQLQFSSPVPDATYIDMQPGPLHWLTADQWKMSPTDPTKKVAVIGSWWDNMGANGGLLPDSSAEFKAGVWYTGRPDLVTPLVQFHVKTDGSYGGEDTGFIHPGTSWQVIPGIPTDTEPPTLVTPELSTWALLGCTALFGIGYMKKRRTP